MYQKLLPWLVLLICTSCTRSTAINTDSPLETPAQSQERQPPLPSLSMVMTGEMVEIQNDWNGYSDITPILRHSKLRLQNGELIGNAHIAVGGYGAAGIHQQATTKVKIPAAVTAKFLTMLTKTPIKTGIYKPIIVHTDDYPHIRIVVKFKQGQAIFSSESQGVNNIPWKVTVGREDPTNDYVTNSNLPAQALKLLDPYLDNSGIDRIIERHGR